MNTSRAAASSVARVDAPRSAVRPACAVCSVTIRLGSGPRPCWAAGHAASLLHRISSGGPTGKALVMSDGLARQDGSLSGVAGAPGVAGSPGGAAQASFAAPEPGRHAPDRNLAMELARVTEAGAMASARWVGRGD